LPDKKLNWEQADKAAANRDISVGSAEVYRRRSNRHMTISIDGWLRMALSEPISIILEVTKSITM